MLGALAVVLPLAADGVARWGTNTVSSIYSTALGDLLTASFSASGTLHEASLSGGDSGGGSVLAGSSDGYGACIADAGGEGGVE